ncbi:MAG: DUF2490 domain-containing protein [Saprospiraceae bacterium]|nr:DUF2490 domain-containing protein [Saprospiraceae bacterium]
MKVLLSFFLLSCMFAAHSVKSQNIRFWGVFQTFTHTINCDKFDWSFNISNLVNPKHHMFVQLVYPASDVRLQIVNIFRYNFNSRWRFGIGLHYQRNFPFDSRYFSEYRPFSQIEFNQSFKRFLINHTLRLNQRWNETKPDNNYDLTFTTQYKTQIIYLLKKFSNVNKLFYLTGYSEEYITLFGPLHFKTFSEYWGYIGVGYQYNKNLKMELGLGYEWMVRNSIYNTRSILYPSFNLITNLRV